MNIYRAGETFYHIFQHFKIKQLFFNVSAAVVDPITSLQVPVEVKAKLNREKLSDQQLFKHLIERFSLRLLDTVGCDDAIKMTAVFSQSAN